MWDMTGLECLVDLTEIEKKRTWEILKEETATELPNLNTMILRARYNSQRHYEIYIFESADIEYDTIKLMFDESPQFIVDLIRERGTEVYSDRVLERTQVIR